MFFVNGASKFGRRGEKMSVEIGGGVASKKRGATFVAKVTP